jgi:hypothetical protein
MAVNQAKVIVLDSCKEHYFCGLILESQFLLFLIVSCQSKTS